MQLCQKGFSPLGTAKAACGMAVTLHPEGLGGFGAQNKRVSGDKDRLLHGLFANPQFAPDVVIHYDAWRPMSENIILTVSLVSNNT